MFYYSQSLILSELASNENGQEQDHLDSEGQDDFENTSIIFELSQSYIQNDNNNNNQHDQNNIANNQQIQDYFPQAGNGNQENNLNANNQNQLDNFQDVLNQQNHHINQQNIANLNNLGLFYLVVNRWLSNLADPVLLTLFFLSGFVNSQSISGDWSDFLKYCNFVVGAFCVITNLVNVLRLIKGKREQILLPLPQNPPQEEVRNAYSQEKLQQNLNNIYFFCLIAISSIQIISMIQNNKYEDNIYQRYLLLVFIYLRVVMFLIFYLNKHPKTIKKLLMYCVTSWPVYRKEFDEYLHYNFDFAIQIQTTFAKDPVQNYLKFMIYIYEFILVLQIIAFGSSWQNHQLIFINKEFLNNRTTIIQTQKFHKQTNR
ncbi:transmembrane protein, putative (macronuclear) [Tetrahymena thermophila SB210]|uniref:Transmembrane protein, putative n=1 Tax=Tetrahymena thermophila (strain SB210) TaxID=312017 RepID=W7X701_TETTS|nr:transmembrane protein, putative [Tetrahymena thermophila SB210]EWS72168.1 transmembrane protein, putative [Tetrahymena thermophila SB210]|eukprot:XP_012655299.1 transmembrane protein, putative [Tetrahymena thermophila SB210]